MCGKWIEARGGGASERNLLALRKQHGFPGQGRSRAISVLDWRASIEKETTTAEVARVTISMLQRVWYFYQDPMECLLLIQRP